MKILIILFLGSLLLGQIGGIAIGQGITIYIHDILLVILLLEGFVQYAIKNKLRKPRLITPVLYFVGAVALSLLTNSGRFPLYILGISSLYLFRWLGYFALYVLVIQRYAPKNYWRYGLFVVGVGFAVLGLVQFVLYPDLRNLFYLGWDPHYYRLFSTLFDPNFVGLMLVFTLLLGVSLWGNIWVTLGELVVAISLLLTYSRSSYLAAIVAMSYLIVAKKRWKMTFILGIAIGAILLLSLTPGITHNLLRTDSTLARLGSWQEGFQLFLQEPIFGHGFDTLRYLTSNVGPIVSKAAAGLDSSILFIAATTGIVGLFAYGYLIYSMVKNSLKFPFYIATLIALGVHSLFVNSGFYAWVLVWMWILTGVVERNLNGDK